MASENSVEITDAPKPFDDESADIILRTSDHVDFRVHKLILSIVSPFFRAMFTLPQNSTSTSEPSNGSSGEETRHGLIVVPVTETSRTLEIILRACYPGSLPRITETEDLKLALIAANKYDMAIFNDLPDSNFISAVKKGPLEIYAIACRSGMQDMADVAARETINQPSVVDRRIAELRDISALHYYDLQQYHRDCAAAVLNATRTTSWFRDIDSTLSQVRPLGCGNCWKASPDSQWWAPDWLWNYLNLLQPLLLVQPWEMVITGQSAITLPLDQTTHNCYVDQGRWVARVGPPRSISGFIDFSRLLAEEMKRAIYEVGDDNLGVIHLHLFLTPYNLPPSRAGSDTTRVIVILLSTLRMRACD